MVRGAAAGDVAARSIFARTYLAVVRAYLGARWKDGPTLAAMDDATQDVFLDCFREDGALGRLDPERRASFRTFLYGVVRNVALRYEERQARARLRQPASEFNPADQPTDDDRLSMVFDRAWAVSLIKRAGERQADAARAMDDAAVRRVDLLKHRFGDGMPIREIARTWNVDAALIHREYARAREEFKAALREEVEYHNPGSPAEIERECAALLAFLRRD